MKLYYVDQGWVFIRLGCKFINLTQTTVNSIFDKFIFIRMILKQTFSNTSRTWIRQGCFRNIKWFITSKISPRAPVPPVEEFAFVATLDVWQPMIRFCNEFVLCMHSIPFFVWNFICLLRIWLWFGSTFDIYILLPFVLNIYGGDAMINRHQWETFF